MKIEKNLATADKIVRLVVATVVTVLFMLGVIGGPLAAGLLVLSGVFVVTTLFSFCPVYKALGLNKPKHDTVD